MRGVFWFPISFGIILIIHIVIYFVQRYVRHRVTPTKLGGESGILAYLVSWWYFVFWPFMEISRPARKRRKWLEQACVKEGDAYLEEGFGFGSSPLLASKIVGKTGMVTAVDAAPINAIALWLRGKTRRCNNLRVILADSSDTQLPNESVDIALICDAFHEFWDKEGTIRELSRVIKPGGRLCIWDESEKRATEYKIAVVSTGVFSLEAQDEAFLRFKKPG